MLEVVVYKKELNDSTIKYFACVEKKYFFGLFTSSYPICYTLGSKDIFAHHETLNEYDSPEEFNTFDDALSFGAKYLISLAEDRIRKENKKVKSITKIEK